MTAKKRPPTHKQASNDFSHHSQNYTWFDKIWKWNKITDMEGKSMDRLGWMGGGVGKWIHFWLFCHATLKRQGCSSQFCSDSSAVCEMWKNKNSISLHHWQRIHSQLCHAAEFSILLDTESISSALVKERRFLKISAAVPLVTTRVRASSPHSVSISILIHLFLGVHLDHLQTL